MVSKNPGGRPKKKREPLVKTPSAFPIDEEFELTEMQAAFVWHYTEGACGQTEAARRAGFSYPASAATKMLNGKSFKNVTRAVRRFLGNKIKYYMRLNLVRGLSYCGAQKSAKLSTVSKKTRQIARMAG
jgi:hypothetical protein